MPVWYVVSGLVLGWMVSGLVLGWIAATIVEVGTRRRYPKLPDTDAAGIALLTVMWPALSVLGPLAIAGVVAALYLYRAEFGLDRWVSR